MIYGTKNFKEYDKIGMYRGCITNNIIYIELGDIGSVSENGVCLTISTSDNQQYLHLIVGCV